MSLRAGRVVRGDGVTRTSLASATPQLPAHRISADEMEARARADALMAAAERRALAVLQAAERRAAETQLRAEEIGRAAGLAEAAGVLERLHRREAELDAAAMDRALTLARLLAERLLGKALELDPSVVVEMAARVVQEARGARRITLRASPDDTPLLRAALGRLDPDGRVHAVVEDPSLRVGDLRLETDVGAIQAGVAPSLDRLVARLSGTVLP